MQEIEILVELRDTIDVALGKLKHLAGKGVRQIFDVYYHDPLREILGWHDQRFNACCRIRQQNDTCFLTYKINHFEGEKWLYAEEYEIEVSDAATAKLIFKQLGLEELITVHNTRHVFETDLYEIVVENVRDLGTFLEVERKGLAVDDVPAAKVELMEFIQSLGLNIGAECNLGKPEMMLLKQATR